MTTATYTTAIESRFATQWAAGPNTLVCYDNVPFIMPAEPEPWVRVEVFDGSVDRASLGRKHLQRSTGTAFFTVYVEKSTGSVGARELVDKIIEIYRDYQQVISGKGTITFYDADVKRLGEVYASGAGSSISSTVGSIQWYAIVVSIAFRYDANV